MFEELPLPMIGIIKTEGIACRTNGNMFKFYTNLKLIFSHLQCDIMIHEWTGKTV